MKKLLTTLLLLATIAGHTQMGTLNLKDLSDSARRALTGSSDLPATQYDTLKIIAEVYKFNYKIAYGAHLEWDSSFKYSRVVEDSIWAFGFDDSTEVHVRKFKAWEVWRKEYRWVRIKGYDYNELVPVEMINRLTYNKKDTLSHVLQSWRVEW